MVSVSVSSCICCLFVSCVHSVAVLNAVFCMTCSLLMLVEDAKGDHIHTPQPHQHCRHPHTLTAHTHATQTTVHASQSPQEPHAQHRVLRQPHKQTKDY